MKNPNIHHKNRHTAFIGDSGSGKSSALAMTLPARGVRSVFWDTNNDHKATGFDSLAEFCRALGRADKASRETGAGFRIAYTGTESVKAFDVFCRAVALILDGGRITHVVIEELAGVSTSVGKARPPFQQLMNQGRKYGAVIYWTTQTPVEIPKTAFRQTNFFYLGKFRDSDTTQYLVKRLSLGLQGELQLCMTTTGKFLSCDTGAVDFKPKLKRFFTAK